MFNFNQNAFITEIENNIKKHKQNLKLIYFSKRLQEHIEKNLRSNKLAEVIKLFMYAHKHTPIISSNNISYIVNEKQVKLQYTYNNKTKILTYKLDGKNNPVNLNNLESYLASLAQSKNVSILKKEITELVRNLRVI